jgi:hypothetical protein
MSKRGLTETSTREGEGRLRFAEADGAVLTTGFEVTLPQPASSLLVHYGRKVPE